MQRRKRERRRGRKARRTCADLEGRERGGGVTPELRIQREGARDLGDGVLEGVGGLRAAIHGDRGGEGDDDLVQGTLAMEDVDSAAELVGRLGLGEGVAEEDPAQGEEAGEEQPAEDPADEPHCCCCCCCCLKGKEKKEEKKERRE